MYCREDRGGILAPSDFHLFKNVKRLVAGKRFGSNKAVIAAINGYFEGLPQSHFRDGIQLLEKRLTKCIKLKGDYVEKLKYFQSKKTFRLFFTYRLRTFFLAFVHTFQ